METYAADGKEHNEHLRQHTREGILDGLGCVAPEALPKGHIEDGQHLRFLWIDLSSFVA